MNPVQPVSGLSFLVIEDNTGDFVLIDDYLRDEIKNVKVDRTATLKVSLVLLGNGHAFDIILLDLSLPDASGEDLVNKILDQSGQAIVIVLTGYANKEFALKTLSLGAYDYLMKDELTGELLAKSVFYSLERQKNNQQLKKSEENYRNLFDMSPNPTLVYDPETLEILNVNKAAVNKYGYSSDEFLTLTIKDIRPKSDIPKLLEAVKRIKDSDEFTDGVWRHKKKNGQIIFVQVQSNSIQFNGKRARLVLASDITEKLKNEELLRESNERYDYVTKATSDAIWDWDLKNDTLFWGDGFTTLFGYDRGNLHANYKTWEENIHPDDAKEVFGRVRELMKDDQRFYNLEYRFRKVDGEYAYVTDKIIVLRDQSGEPVRMIGAMQDVTKAKQEEERLRLLESVVTNTTDSVLITESEPIDEPGPRIVYVNDAFTRMTGYTREDALGKNPRFLQGEKTDRNELDKIRRSMERWKPSQVEVINYKKDGTEFWNSMAIAPVADETGWFTHWISIERDVTDRRRQLEAIEEQNKKLREIAWFQSHVVRAPLARLLGLIDVIKNDTELSEYQGEVFDLVTKSALELDEIIREIVNRTEDMKT